MQSINRITIKQTREQLAQIIEEVAIAKRSYLITKFNKPKAMLIPVETERVAKRGSGLSASFGVWSSKKEIKNSAEWTKNLRKKMSSRL